MNASQQTEWSRLIDEIVALTRRSDRREISIQEYSTERRELIAQLAEQVRTRGVEPTEGVTYLHPTDFRDLGLLQEVNRLFFHPRGLALEVHADEEGRGSMAPFMVVGVWDDRADPDGMWFGPDTIDQAKVDSVAALVTHRPQDPDGGPGVTLADTVLIPTDALSPDALAATMAVDCPLTGCGALGGYTSACAPVQPPGRAWTSGDPVAVHAARIPEAHRG